MRPNAVAKTVALLQAAPTQEEQVDLRGAFAQRERRDGTSIFAERICRGGTPVVRPSIPRMSSNGLKTQAFGSITVPALHNFMSHAHEEAKFTMSPDEIIALSDVLTAYTAMQTPKPAPPLASRKLVKEWTTADLQPLLDQVGKGRSFARGKDSFLSGPMQCLPSLRRSGRSDRPRSDRSRHALQAAGYSGSPPPSPRKSSPNNT